MRTERKNRQFVPLKYVNARHYLTATLISNDVDGEAIAHAAARQAPRGV